MVWKGIELSQLGFGRIYIYWGFLVLPTFAFAFWVFSHRVQWRIDRQVIQKLAGYRLTIRQEWQAEGVRAVEIVQQFHNATRFSQLAPGVHLLTKNDSRIDLGVHGNPETVREIASAVADFYSVPFEYCADDEAFRKFRHRKLVTLLVALAIVAVIVLARELF